MFKILNISSNSLKTVQNNRKSFIKFIASTRTYSTKHFQFFTNFTLNSTQSNRRVPLTILHKQTLFTNSRYLMSDQTKEKPNDGTFAHEESNQRFVYKLPDNRGDVEITYSKDNKTGICKLFYC